MRIVRVVDDHRSTEAITVLSGQVAVVPECACLTEAGELIEERVTRRNRTLVHKGGPILPVGAFLIDAVEMLSNLWFSFHKQRRADEQGLQRRSTSASSRS